MYLTLCTTVTLFTSDIDRMSFGDTGHDEEGDVDMSDAVEVWL